MLVMLSLLSHMQPQGGAQRRCLVQAVRAGPAVSALDLLKIIFCIECRAAGGDDRHLQSQHAMRWSRGRPGRGAAEERRATPVVRQSQFKCAL